MLPSIKIFKTQTILFTILMLSLFCTTTILAETQSHSSSSRTWTEGDQICTESCDSSSGCKQQCVKNPNFYPNPGGDSNSIDAAGHQHKDGHNSGIILSPSIGGIFVTLVLAFLQKQIW